MKQLKIVVVGLGKISTRVIAGIDAVEGFELYGVVSSSPLKAEAIRQTHPNVQYFEEYEDALYDHEVDVIYICTPNQVHEAQIRQAIQHGKHVCCEKPMLVKSHTVKELYALAKEYHVQLFEMQKAVHLPLTQLVKYHLQMGTIGEINYIEASFGRISTIEKDAWIRNIMYGGAALDVGVYPLSYVLYLLDQDQVELFNQYSDFRHGYEQTWVCTLKMSSGTLVNLQASKVCNLANECVIHGTRGTIRIPHYWKGDTAYLINDDEETTLTAIMSNDFAPQLEHAYQSIVHHQKVLWGEHEVLQYLQILER